mmetsp:Transcript_15670/g.38631  ORF Transcript_15670/g.38631 Transcript_15670/m.38631 type:complete len:167 (-) Transcript_15670:356-856(-)|eukprot:CAMPEP_0114524090 /NCGR_PEP_ID=MMETSP0109-20121206/21658_1 /TAXON_ID=29199 /ORGANISM="Chlorarachnion reptans, Strain CCCM449" /LENGTH=166 /DNA_ID=CAMNT_0001705487 /DNA_START=19 /DNA_END=519 /DNA_ORIENTATION=-
MTYSQERSIAKLVAIGLFLSVLVYLFSPSASGEMHHAKGFVRASQRAFSSTKPSPYRVAWITVPDRKVADQLSEGLVQKRLAACVSIVPGLVSTYTWKGKVERDEEMLLMVKTRASLMNSLIDFVQKNHPYDSPEVIATEISEGRKEYLDWIDENTLEGGGDEVME